MRFLISLILALPLAATTYQVAGDEQTSWPDILESIGITKALQQTADVVIIPAGAAAKSSVWMPRIEAGQFVIIEADSELATALGIRQTDQKVLIRGVSDQLYPKTEIVWEKALELKQYELPAGARIFAKERFSGAPLVASVQHGKGTALWLIAPPGRRGYERFPYIPQALQKLGIATSVRGNRLWAFFDGSYRLRVDLNYIAQRWRESGISALHVAAWHYYDKQPESEAFLARLIEACHRNAILVYAWLELPHVSEGFWRDNPQCREKTALLQDAQLDWRKLVNLQNTACASQVSTGIKDLISRHDWDGVNLAELYFESLEGIENPARFTPFNDDARKLFQESTNLDALEVVKSGDATARRKLLDFRADLAHRMQIDWLAQIESLRTQKPHLDITLTHIDDQYDTRMRDLLGADAKRQLAEKRGSATFLIEDPATIWNLGPKRYAQIADKYRSITPDFTRLAIDINVVERYQDVYPTKRQTGTELFQLVRQAAVAFPRVALYFENSIDKHDLPLLPAASSGVSRVEKVGSKLVVESPRGAGIGWEGEALVDGRPWPVNDGGTVWLPPGPHAIEAAPQQKGLRVLYFNGALSTATRGAQGVELSYNNASRALAVLDRKPLKTEIDGTEAAPPILESNGAWIVTLPRGQHIVSWQ